MLLFLLEPMGQNWDTLVCTQFVNRVSYMKQLSLCTLLNKKNSTLCIINCNESNYNYCNEK